MNKYKEFSVEIVITTPDNITEDSLFEQMVEWLESKGWKMGGGINEINQETFTIS